jgi:hypothetical protein
MCALLDRESLPVSSFKENNCDPGVNGNVMLSCALDRYKFSLGLTGLNWF